MKKSYAFPAIIALASLSTSLGAQPVDGPADPAPAAMPAAPAEAKPAAPATAPAAAQLVDREFASYDLDKSGALSATEFATWVAKLRKPAAEGAAPRDDGQQFSASLFARADVDRNQQVSKTEMATLLASAKG